MSPKLAPTRGDLLAFVISLPVRLLKPWILVRLVRLNVSFGDSLRAPFSHLVRLEHERRYGSRKTFDIAFWRGTPPNQQLYRLWSRHLRFPPHKLHTILVKPLTVVAWYWERSASMQQHVVDYTCAESIISPFINSKTLSSHQLLSTAEKRDAQRCLEELGVIDAERIALIHVRNSSHDVSDNHVIDNRVCNADAKAFQGAVDHLRDLGYVVITMGNHPSSPAGLDGVVEYHRSAERTPLRDFTLGSVADLYIGTATGAPATLAIQFRIPALWTDQMIFDTRCPFESFEYGQAVVLLKHHFNSGKQMSLREVMLAQLPPVDSRLRDLNVTVEDNSPVEILDGLKDLLALGRQAERWDEKRGSYQQVQFFRLFDQFVKYPRSCKVGGAIISPSFLDRHPHFLA